MPKPTQLGYGALPELELPESDTDPDVFGNEEPTVPRCLTCGRRSDMPTSFQEGVDYALRGVRFMLVKKMPADEADHLVLWLRSGIK